jgi:hypothetical protein
LWILELAWEGFLIFRYHKYSNLATLPSSLEALQDNTFGYKYNASFVPSKLVVCRR